MIEFHFILPRRHKAQREHEGKFKGRNKSATFSTIAFPKRIWE